MLEIYDVIYFLKNFGRFGRVYGKEFVGVAGKRKTNKIAKGQF